jgi:hypothetical protein
MATVMVTAIGVIMVTGIITGATIIIPALTMDTADIIAPMTATIGNRSP